MRVKKISETPYGKMTLRKYELYDGEQFEGYLTIILRENETPTLEFGEKSWNMGQKYLSRERLLRIDEELKTGKISLETLEKQIKRGLMWGGCGS